MLLGELLEFALERLTAYKSGGVLVRGGTLRQEARDSYLRIVGQAERREPQADALSEDLLGVDAATAAARGVQKAPIRVASPSADLIHSPEALAAGLSVTRRRPILPRAEAGPQNGAPMSGWTPTCVGQAG